MTDDQILSNVSLNVEQSMWQLSSVHAKEYDVQVTAGMAGRQALHHPNRGAACLQLSMLPFSLLFLRFLF